MQALNRREFLAGLGLGLLTIGQSGLTEGIAPTRRKSLLIKPGHVYVTQSWDDAVLNDIRLVALLKKYQAKATFFIDVGNLSPERQPRVKESRPGYPNWGWLGYGKLSISDVKELYADANFEIGSHSMTHPPLAEMPDEALHREISESKRLLEQWLGKPVKGFAYPGGTGAIDRVKSELKKAGYLYARTIMNDSNIFPPKDPYELHVSVHVTEPDFWGKFEQVKKRSGIFYFWGHSFEFGSEKAWSEFEKNLANLSSDPAVRWVTNRELFEAASLG